MSKPKKYILVSVRESLPIKATKALAVRVSEKLSDGWELYGNPIVLENGFACQAMIKEDESKEKAVDRASIIP